MTNLESKCSTALSIAARGFRVFPLGANSKIPMLKKWSDLATTDEATIKQWWSGNFEQVSNKGKAYKIPANANIGISPGTDYVIVDVDTSDSHAACGAAELRKLVDEGLPKTLTIRTPSGGLHLYYKHPNGSLDVQGMDTSYIKSVANWRGDEARPTGIDIRGNKGQGVAPGSTIDGVAYEIISTVAPAELPAHIAAQLPFKKSIVANIRELPAHLQGMVPQADKSLDVTKDSLSELPDVVKLGTRDTVLFKYACSWRERGHSMQVASILMADLIDRCEQGDDPITLDEGLEKLERAYSEYSPSKKADWIEIATPTGERTTARRTDVDSLQAALDRFIYVEDGEQVVDLSRHPTQAVFKLREFKSSFCNIKLEVGKTKDGEPSTAQLPTVWLAHPARQTVRGVGYQPLSPNATSAHLYKYRGDEFFNTWTGTSLKAPAVADPELISMFYDHLEFLFCGDTAALKHFIDWLCFTVRFPKTRITHALLLVGDTRTGKGWIAGLMKLLLGEQNVVVAHNSDLHSDHNTWISNSTLSIVDDIIPTEGTRLWAKVKSDITEECVEVNHKYGKKGQERIFANILMFSNYDDAIHLERTDQRLWVFKSEAERRSDAYYTKLFAWLKSEGPAHVLRSMLDRDLSKFSAGALPDGTSAKRTMVELSQGLFETTIMDAIAEEYSYFAADIVGYQEALNYISLTHRLDNINTADQHAISKIMRNLVSKPLPSRRYKIDGVPTTLYCVRNAEKWSQARSKLIAAEYRRGMSSKALTLVMGGDGT